MRMFVNTARLSLQVTRMAGCLALLLLMAGCHSANGWIMNNSGMGYYQKGDYAKAHREFQRAVVDRPKNADHRHNLAMALQRQGDTAGAETVLRHNLSVDPMHQPTYHALTQILLSQQRTAEADQLLTGWRESQPYVPEAHVEHAWLQHETGNRVAAEQSLRQALQVKPNHPMALAHLGQLYHEGGQPDQAAAYYQRSLLSKWNQPEVKSRLATLTGSSSTNLRRSALLHNDANMQMAGISTAPMYAAPLDGQPMVAQSLVITGDPIVMEDPAAHRHAHRRHRFDFMNGGANQQVTAYPLPNYGMADAGGWPSGMIATAPGGAPMYAASPTFISETSIAGQPSLAPPVIGTSSTPMFGTSPTVMIGAAPGATPHADPAHATEVTAGLPVVAPY